MLRTVEMATKRAARLSAEEVIAAVMDDDDSDFNDLDISEGEDPESDWEFDHDDDE